MGVLSKIYYFLFLLFFTSCSSNDDQIINVVENPIIGVPETNQLQYLALGDSYTIGESVCGTCSFPAQLKQSMSFLLDADVGLEIIAQTGWTTTNLKNAIVAQEPDADYDMVTLLIGVNNQYQNRPFTLYEQEFPELLNTAISLAKGNKNNVIVVSIPDYAFTPFGQSSPDPIGISTQIDQYNAFAENYATQNGIVFVNITDITREGIQNPNLVASDGLHPSQLAYSKFVERILPGALLAMEE